MSTLFPSSAMNAPLGAVRNLNMTVTGEDAGNNIFREKVAVLSLQSNDCTFESRLRVQPGNSLMVEIAPAQSGERSWRAAAIVEAVSAVGNSENLFQIRVLLGRTYESAVFTGAPPSAAPKTTPPSTVPVKPVPQSASAPAPSAKTAPRASASRPPACATRAKRPP
jgi:hypothetical protein